DQRDQLYFDQLLADANMEATIQGEGSKRLTLRPFMQVLNETINQYVVNGYLKKIDDTLIKKFMETIAQHGFDPLEFGLTEETIRARLSVASAQNIAATPLPVQPQRRREAL